MKILETKVILLDINRYDSIIAGMQITAKSSQAFSLDFAVIMLCTIAFSMFVK